LKVIYLDTCALDHLGKRWGATDSDEQRLLSLVDARDISVPLSIITVEEILSEMKSLLTDAIVSRLRLLLRLTDPGRTLKPPYMLLTDDISSYAATGHRGSPLLSGPAGFDVRLALSELLDHPRTERIKDIREIMRSAKDQKEKFGQYIGSGMSEMRKELRLAKSRGETFPNFVEYFNSRVEKTVEHFAERVGVLAQCRSQGLEGLLRIPSVSMAVGSMLSFGYSVAVEGVSAKGSYSRDLQHAPVAAARAEFFVTDDQALVRLLKRVPNRNFDLLSLGELLHSLRAQSQGWREPDLKGK